MRRWLAVLCILSGQALAQTYPAKPVSLIFPWPPGGADALPRAMAASMSETLGQPVVMENRPGAGGTIGLATVARAAPDGYTLAITDITSHAISGSLYKKLPYHVVKDFAPVAMAARTPLALVAHPSLNVKSFQEFISLARSQPGKLNFASSGNGAITHLAVERLKRRTGVDLVHVPYNGSAAAVTAVLGGNASVAFATVPSVLANARAGKLVLLAQTFARPVAQLADVPAVASFVPDFDMGLYQGILAPAGTPRAIVDRVHAAAVRSIESPKVGEVMKVAVLEPARMDPDEFRTFLEREARSWGELVESLGLKVD